MKLSNIKTAMLVLVAVFGMITSAIAQSGIKEELALINNNYLLKDKLSFKVNYSVYAKNTSTALETATGHFKYETGKISQRLFDHTMIVNNGYILLVDTAAQVIMLDSNYTPPTPVKPMNPMNLDSLFKIYKNVSVSNISGELKKYTFTYNSGYEISKAEMIVNVNSLFVTKLVLYYTEPVELENGDFQEVRMVMDFTEYNTNPTFTNDFSELRYLDYVNGAFQLKPQYSSFTLVSHV